MTRECRHCIDHPWVLACAHFGDGEVTLRDYGHPSYVALYGSLDEQCDGCGCDPSCPFRYEVFVAFGAFGPYDSPYRGDDYDAALAAFREAETALLLDGVPLP